MVWMDAVEVTVMDVSMYCLKRKKNKNTKFDLSVYGMFLSS